MQKLFESVTYNFLTIAKYVNHLYPDRRAESDFKLAGQDILCIFWTYLHFFRVLFIFYHVRCQNILICGH